MKPTAMLVYLCVAIVPAAGQWRTNLADNPSAELNANRDALPDGWQPSAFRSPAKLAWDRRVGHFGGASLRISDSANPAGQAWNDRTGRWVSAARKPVKTGAPYTLGVWVRTESVTGQASACIAWWQGGHWLAESYTKRVTGTAGWQWLTVTATAPKDADGAQVYLGLSQSRGTAWFDDVTFVEGDRAGGRLRPVDLRAACNTGFHDETKGDGKGGWTDQGADDLRSLPLGRIVLRGVPFDVIDPEANAGRSCIVLRGELTPHRPPSATIRLGRTCRTLYFLHACAAAPEEKGDRLLFRAGAPIPVARTSGKSSLSPFSGTLVGRYELVYEDGSVAKLPLTAGRQIGDWRSPAETKQAAVAWEADGPASKPIGLLVYPAANPKPDKAVRSIRAVSAGEGPAVMLVAVTTSDGPAVLTERPIRYEFNDTTGWYPFNFALDDTNLDAIDLTGLLDAPAGKHGFLSVRGDGGFYFADGTRARFFGTNICGPRAFPDKPAARTIAARLAKYGVNLVRIHAVDGQWGGLIDYSKSDSRHLDAGALDRLDYFVAELARRGIYLYFDLLDYRRFVDGDGVRDASKFRHGWRDSIKGATIYNDRLIELQQEFATTFLTHRNRYTKLRYVDDPAVAVVEITNENSVFYFHNTLLTLPSYVDELRARWNRWLLARHGSRSKLAGAWTDGRGRCALAAGEDPARGTVFLPMKHLYQDPARAGADGRRSPLRVDDMVRFFFDLERSYYGRMRAHLKRIGVKVPITGTNQTFCPAGNHADACNDFMSRNNYWLHPGVRSKPFVTFRNFAAVASDAAGRSNPITEIASSAVAGKPMISPEFNFPWPNEFRSECLPLMAAYACLQDWDGMLFFAYNPEGKALEHFGSQSDPVRWGQFPAAAMMFHRRDVSAARHTVHVAASRSTIFTARPSHGRQKASPYRFLPYVFRVRNYYFDGVYDGRADAVVALPGSAAAPYARARRAYVGPGDRWDLAAFCEAAGGWGILGPNTPAAVRTAYRSDTGELAFRHGEGIFTADTPRTKAVVGLLGKAGAIRLAGVSVECRTPFAAVTVSSLDARPVGRSRRLLVTAVARAENTGQAFYRNKTAIPEKGRPPVLVEPVDCTVRLAMPARATVCPLDETGRPRRPLPSAFDGRQLRFDTAAARSPWLRIAVD